MWGLVSQLEVLHAHGSESGIEHSDEEDHEDEDNG